jgi:hypothetical protein
VHMGDIPEGARDNLVELVKAAYEVYDACWDYLWGKKDPANMRTARIRLGSAVTRMYQLYQDADFDCPKGLKRDILTFKEQMDLIEATLEADEINAARRILQDAAQVLYADLKVLADKLDIDLDPLQEEKEEEKQTFLGTVLGIFGIRRK